MEQQTSFASRPAMLDTGYKLVSIDILGLSFIEAARSYCILHMADGRTNYQVCHPLGSYESRLPKDSFVRVSRSYIINIHHVRCIEGNRVYVDGHKAAITVSASYRHVLDDRFIVF